MIEPSVRRVAKALELGKFEAWGASYAGGTGAPADSGYIKIYSTMTAFTALKADGSIKAWG
jgi:hypothetical protein